MTRIASSELHLLAHRGNLGLQLKFSLFLSVVYNFMLRMFSHGYEAPKRGL